MLLPKHTKRIIPHLKRYSTKQNTPSIHNAMQNDWYDNILAETKLCLKDSKNTEVKLQAFSILNALVKKNKAVNNAIAATAIEYADKDVQVASLRLLKTLIETGHLTCSTYTNYFIIDIIKKGIHSLETEVNDAATNALISLIEKNQVLEIAPDLANTCIKSTSAIRYNAVRIYSALLDKNLAVQEVGDLMLSAFTKIPEKIDPYFIHNYINPETLYILRRLYNKGHFINGTLEYLAIAKMSKDSPINNIATQFFNDIYAKIKQLDETKS